MCIRILKINLWPKDTPKKRLHKLKNTSDLSCTGLTANISSMVFLAIINSKKV